MSIDLVTAPATTPSAVGDYTAQNNLIAALALAAQGAARVVGSNVVKGAVFLVGGSVYLAAADTSISGAASDYVKLTITGTTLVPSFVSSLAGVTWSSTWNGYYDASGNLYEFDEAKAYIEGIISTIYQETSRAKLRHGIKQYTASGNFVAPEKVTTVFITAIGGGGTGGTGVTGATYGGSGGGGGGSGARCYKNMLTVVPRTSYAITIGIAVSTTFGALLSIPSGGNGSGNTPGSAGSGTAPGIFPGRAGTAGVIIGSGSLGGAGGVGAVKYPDMGITGAPGGAGATSGVGGAGSTATHYGDGGGGGGGGYAGGSVGGSGGSGMAGILVIEW